MNDQSGISARPMAWSNAKQINVGSNVRRWQGANKGNMSGKVPMGTVGKSTTYQPPHRRFTSMEIDEKRAKGLCFWCDEKFTFGHKCANRKLYSMVLEQVDEEEETRESEEQENESEEGVALSLHALHGVESSRRNQTMKLVGHFKKRRLNILIDSGSTHNFLDQAVAKQVGCAGQRIIPQKIRVANGDQMDCNAIISDFVWTMQGKRFEAKVLLMPLRGCELILGMEWLNTNGVIQWDFPNRTMTFQWGGEKVMLTAKMEQKENWKEGAQYNGIRA